MIAKAEVCARCILEITEYALRTIATLVHSMESTRSQESAVLLTR
jgi:hypothetical protein